MKLHSSSEAVVSTSGWWALGANRTSSKTESCMFLKVSYHFERSPFFITSLILYLMASSSSLFSFSARSMKVILTSNSSFLVTFTYFFSKFYWMESSPSEYSQLNSLSSSTMFPGEISMSWSVMSLNLKRSRVWAVVCRTSSSISASPRLPATAFSEVSAVLFDLSSWSFSRMFCLVSLWETFFCNHGCSLICSRVGLFLPS